MKKLMFAFAAVAMAACAQAASAQWSWSVNSSSPVFAPGSTTSPVATGMSAYLFCDLTEQQIKNIVSDFAAGTFSASGYELASETAAGGVITKKNIDTDTRTAGSTYSWTMVIANKENLFIDTIDATRGADGKNAKIQFSELANSQLAVKDASAGYAGAGWYTAAVPEPTSGLLLLLGVAGLALRRRRA